MNIIFKYPGNVKIIWVFDNIISEGLVHLCDFKNYVL